MKKVHVIYIEFAVVDSKHRIQVVIIRLIQMMRLVMDFFLMQRGLLARTVTVVDAMRRTLMRLSNHLFFLVFETFLSPQITSILEHITGVWM